MLKRSPLPVAEPSGEKKVGFISYATVRLLDPLLLLPVVVSVRFKVVSQAEVLVISIGMHSSLPLKEVVWSVT
jgi:hypothetical protein